MAAIRDQLEIIYPNGEIRFYPLGPEKGILRIGPGLENDLVIESPDLSSVQIILDYRQQPYQLIGLSQAGEIKLQGRSLPPRIPSPFYHLETVEIAGHLIILLEGETAEKARSLPQLNPPREEPRPLMTSRLRPAGQASTPLILAELSAADWMIEVEQTATSQLTLRNGSSTTIPLVVSITGLPENWVSVSPAQLTLTAGEQASVTITLCPPRQPTSLAGVYPFAVAVTSPDYPDWHCQQQAVLRVSPSDEFTIGELTPKRQAIGWTKRSGQLVLPITNKGNRDALLRLTAADEGQVCSFEFQIPGEAGRSARQAELRLPPGKMALVPVYITPPPGRWLSWRKPAYYFTVTAALLTGQSAQRSVLGQLTHKPLLGPGLITLLTLCLLLLTLPLFQRLLDRYLAGPGPEQAMQQPEDQASSLDWLLAILPTPPPPPAPARRSQMTYQEMFQEIGPQYGLDWRILAEQAYRESRLNPLALGQANDMGLMQIIPLTWNEWAPKVGVTDPYDPYSNVTVGAAYLAYLRDYYWQKGYVEPYWMLIAYNWGPDRLDKLFASGGGLAQVPERTRNYALGILQAAERRPLNPVSFDQVSLPPVELNLTLGSSSLDELLAQPVQE